MTKCTIEKILKDGAITQTARCFLLLDRADTRLTPLSLPALSMFLSWKMFL